VSPFVDEDNDAENENDADCGVHAWGKPFRESILVSHSWMRGGKVSVSSNQ
jgi:hypothetical protein